MDYGIPHTVVCGKYKEYKPWLVFRKRTFSRLRLTIWNIAVTTRNNAIQYDNIHSRYLFWGHILKSMMIAGLVTVNLS